MPSLIGRSIVIALLATACSSSPKTPANPAPAEPVTPPAAAPAATPTADTLTAVEIVYGLATFVMDSPRGQQDKAEVAVKESALAKQLEGMGLTVTYRFDKAAAGDDVIVKTLDGAELGRTPLIDLGKKDAPTELIEKVQARVAPTK